ncbi:MAG TPA: phosphatase PAP2 family protein [Gammaproteobacteria bacterium]|nr:phosphatase PAP2 family protein [Gammaproteobacteria bacterium]
MSVRALLVLALAAAPAFAQDAQPATGVPLFRPSDAAILGGALAGSVVLFHYDARITAWKGLTPFQNSPGTRRVLDAAAFIGGPGSIGIEAAMWGAGRIWKNPNLATDGETAIEAAALSGVVTFAVKGIAGRARPYLDSTRANNFSFGRGISASEDYQSFPSEHTAAAFAFATAMTARLQVRHSPSVKWAAPVLYGLATLTGISRVYGHDHWASDCLFGAAIGTVSGLVSERWHERHP